MVQVPHVSRLNPLQKQMQYLETQQRESEVAKEEAKRLRVKMKTYERWREHTRTHT